MHRKLAHKKSKSFFAIYLSFFLLLSIPLVILGATGGSFDIRNHAFDDITVSDENPCVISLPNVNPYTLEVGKTITVQVDATLKDAAIASLSITDSTGNNIYTEAFENAPLSIATSFKYTPTKAGTVDMLGLITKVGGGSVACQISSEYDVLGLKAMANNEAPEFTSTLANATPSRDIKTGTTFEYTLTATDADGDRINYSYSFTPNADWLKATVIEDGSDGKLTIKFQGSTTKAASYLANVFIHDGYSKHLSAQTWVISVSPAENDTPVVTVISPSTSTQITKESVLKAKWEASDLNLITKYALYISTNPADESSWIKINDSIPAKTTSYSIDTSTIAAGTYKLIVQATDNQSPALTGVGISPEIIITGSSTSDDDVVVISDPQITNMTPSSTDTITNTQVTIKATLIAGESATVDDDSIVVKLDDQDITSDISINKISDQEHTVIYQPTEALAAGLHKVEITYQDTNDKTADKAWTFTIISEDTTTTSGTITLLGMEISQRTLIIIGVGLLVVILAIVAPIIIFKVWKEEKNKEDINPNESNVFPNVPVEPIPITPTTQTTEVSEMVKAPEQEEPDKTEDVWDNYSAPTPEVKEEIKPVVPEVETSTPIPTVEPEVIQPKEAIKPTTPVVEAPQPPQVVEPEIVQPTQAVTPPEPDITNDLGNPSDFADILAQIQQTENESNKPADNSQ